MNKHTRKRRQFIIFLSDFLLLCAAIPLTLFIRDFELPTFSALIDHVLHFLPMIFYWLLCMYIFKLYNLNQLFIKKAGLMALAISASSSLLFGFSLFYLFFSSITPRGVLILYSFISFIILACWRTLWSLIFKCKKNLPSVLFVGYDESIKDLIPMLTSSVFLRFKILGIYDAERSVIGNLYKINIINTKEALIKVLQENLPDLIILNTEKHTDLEIKKELFALLESQCQFVLLADFFEIVMRKIPVGSIHDAWLLSNIDLSSKQYFFFLKRSFDIIFSIVALVIMALPCLVTAICIKLDSKGPVFFKQIREGKYREPFIILKFRTMKTEGNSYTPTAAGDARITKLGGFLRKTRLDEIPQLLNVLIGQMSLIGPRPERPELSRELEKSIPYYKQRMLVKPGITGWDQVSGEYHSPSVEDTYKKLQYDLYYIKNISILLDLSIISKTIFTIFARTGR